MKIDGEWKGYYENETLSGAPGVHEKYPVSGTLSCDNGRIQGTMMDERTLDSASYQDIVAAQRHTMTVKESIEADHFILHYPDTFYNSVLSSKSELEGEFDPPRVSFVKQYIGVSRSYWSGYGQEQPVQEEPGHKVWYRGALSDDGNVI